MWRLVVEQMQISGKMALSIEQILEDAHTLVGRLKEHDTSAESLISTTQTVCRKIDSMKQVNFDIISIILARITYRTRSCKPPGVA